MNQALRCGLVFFFTIWMLWSCGAVPEAGQVLAAEKESNSVGSPTEEAVIVILGASYAGGWNPHETDGIHFVNKGVSGQQSFEVLARIDSDVIALHPRAVILWGYINDIFRSRAEDLEKTKARARESFEEMVRLAKENGIEPILATEVTIRSKAGFKEGLAGLVGSILGKESYQDRVNSHVIELNNWLREYAGEQDLLLLDFAYVLAGSDGRRKKEFAKDDGSHIPPAGYHALDAYSGPILANRFGE